MNAPAAMGERPFDRLRANGDTQEVVAQFIGQPCLMNHATTARQRGRHRGEPEGALRRGRRGARDRSPFDRLRANGWKPPDQERARKPGAPRRGRSGERLEGCTRRTFAVTCTAASPKRSGRRGEQEKRGEVEKARAREHLPLTPSKGTATI